jgi:hypothetical protein
MLTNTNGASDPTMAPTPTNYDGGRPYYSNSGYNKDGYFILAYNSLCGEVPSEVIALADSSIAGPDFTNIGNGHTYSSFDMYTGNSLGTECCVAYPGAHSCSPTPVPTSCGDRYPDICNLISCSDDVSSLCESEFCATCTFAHSCGE